MAVTDIVVNQSRGKEIHVIADNIAAHKSQAGNIGRGVFIPLFGLKRKIMRYILCYLAL